MLYLLDVARDRQGLGVTKTVDVTIPACWVGQGMALQRLLIDFDTAFAHADQPADLMNPMLNRGARDRLPV